MTDFPNRDRVHGGARKNAGRPPGALNKDTLKQKKVLQAVQQKIMKKAGRLVSSVFQAAEGEQFLYRRDIRISKGSTKKNVEYVLVTDPKEIERFLNDHDAYGGDEEGVSGEKGDGKNEGQFYIIKTKPSDWKAAEALMDRVFGKSTQMIEVEDNTRSNEEKYGQLTEDQIDRQIEERERAIAEATGRTVEEVKNEATERLRRTSEDG